MFYTKDLLEQSAPLTRKWEDEVRRAITKNPDQKERWSTVSDLDIKRLYTPEDVQGMDFASDVGVPDFRELLKTRRAVSVFQDKEVSEPLVREIIADCSDASSGAMLDVYSTTISDLIKTHYS